MTFTPGQKVRCIAESAKQPQQGDLLPQVGRVYTVREAVTVAMRPVIRLVEIVNTPKQYGSGEPFECAFAAERFVLAEEHEA